MTTFFPNANPMLNGKNFLLFLFLTLFLILTMTSRAHDQKIITFDAPNSGTAAGQGTEATAINLEGTITGNVTDNNFGTHGFVRSPNGRFTNFDAPGADPIVGCTCPNSINDLGVIAGSTIDTNGVNHGFVRAPEGQFIIFDDSRAPAGNGAGQGTSPVAINDFGVIAGTYTDGNNANHGFVRSAFGKITTFDAPGASQGTFPGNINNFGVIVGTFLDTNFVSHGFIRSPEGKFAVFDAPGSVGGPVGTFSAFINDLGVIAGSYYDATSDVEFGFLRWPNGQFEQFAAPKASTAAFAGTNLLAINLEGTTTGFVFDHVDSQGNAETHAFVRAANGHATTFDVPGQIDVPNPELFGSAGTAINAVGVVAGRLHDVNLVAHAFLRLP
jgi:hypothetical protein